MEAAFRSPRTGRITTGPTHADAFWANDVAMNEITEDQLLDGEGFWDGKRFWSRAETNEAFGFSTVEEMG